MSEYKKPVLIAAGIVGIAFFGLYLKNYIEQTKFQPLKRDQIIKIYKQIKKQNYTVLKQVAMMATQIGSQFKQLNPEMIRGYLQGPETPIKINELFQENTKKVCAANGISVQQFQLNMQHYKADDKLKNLVEQSQKDFQVSLSGKIPQLNVKIPQSLTKQRVLEIQTKVARQKYLLQIEIFRKLKGHTQQQLMSNPDLMKGLPNPDVQEQKLLQQQIMGIQQEPASAVFHSAIVKFRPDNNFRSSLMSIQNSFKNIFERYQVKMQTGKITQAQLTELQDQIIYFQNI